MSKRITERPDGRSPSSKKLVHYLRATHLWNPRTGCGLGWRSDKATGERGLIHSIAVTLVTGIPPPPDQFAR